MFISVIVFLSIFFVYVLGVSPSVYGGDSGDVIVGSWFGGVIHPPGYPLNTILGWVFTHLPYEATIAYKANLMAAFLNAIVIVFTYLTCRKLTKNTFVALAASLTLGFTVLFWLYAHIIEVFQLNLVLVAASTYFFVAWRETNLNKKANRVLLNMAFLFWGLASFHHHTSVLLFPGIAYFVFKTDKKFLRNKFLMFRSFLFFVLGFVPYVFIPFAAFRKTPINWDDPYNLTNFIRLVTRADYGTFTASSFLLTSTLKQRLIHVLDYVLFVKADFSYTLILIAIGAVYCFLKNRTMFWFIFLCAMFTGPFFLFYSSFPIETDFYIGLWERFILTSYFFLVLFLAFGFKLIVDITNVLLPRIIKARIVGSEALKLLLVLSLFLIPFSFFLINYSKANLSNFKLGDWLANDILSSAESNAIVILLGDTALFNTQYLYYTSPEDRNIKLIKGGSIAQLYYRQQVATEYQDLNYPEGFFDRNEPINIRSIEELVKANVDKFPIYIGAYAPNIENFHWVPVGLLNKLVPNNQKLNGEELHKINKSRFDRFEYKDFGTSTGYTQFMSTHIKETYYSSLIGIAKEFMNSKDYDYALDYLNRAVQLLPDKKDAYALSGNIYAAKKECDLSRRNFEKVFELDNKDWQALSALSKVYGECFIDKKQAETLQSKADNLKKRGEEKLN